MSRYVKCVQLVYLPTAISAPILYVHLALMRLRRVEEARIVREAALTAAVRPEPINCR